MAKTTDRVTQEMLDQTSNAHLKVLQAGLEELENGNVDAFSDRLVEADIAFTLVRALAAGVSEGWDVDEVTALVISELTEAGYRREDILNANSHLLAFLLGE